MANLPQINNNYVLFEINDKLDRILKAFETLLDALPQILGYNDIDAIAEMNADSVY